MKQILLIVSGGIAACKAPLLVRDFQRAGYGVRTILTAGGAQFTTPLTLASLSKKTCHTELFDLTQETDIGHIELSRSADLIVVAPATANLLAKAANGLADDLASTVLSATDTPVLYAPAMNVRMWQNAATQRNIAFLKENGARFIGPNKGEMACGEFGPGRMSEPDEIVTAAMNMLEPDNKPLTGKTALVTAGPTHEPIDPVRYIANRSSGKQGYAIAAALAHAGAQVTLVSGPTAMPAPENVTRISVETAQQMLEACETHLPADIAIFAAAVADWRVKDAAARKIKKTKDGLPDLSFAENPDILKTISKSAKRPALVIGFAAETDTVLQNAQAKLAAKGCDWIVANDVSPETGVMGGDMNTVHLISADGIEDWPTLSKQEVAAKLIERIATRFNEPNIRIA